MPNKITDGEIYAALRAYWRSDNGLDDQYAHMRRALEAYERAKWRPGAPTEDGEYICQWINGPVYRLTVKDGVLRDGPYEIGRRNIRFHAPYFAPLKEGNA